MRIDSLDRNVAPPRLLDGAGLVLKCEPSGDGYAATLDDDTIAYVLAAQKSFRKLRQAISQIAGALVLDAASGTKSSIADDGFRLARISMAEVLDLFGSASPSRSSTHHHHHLGIAIGLVGEALAAQKRSSGMPSAANPERDLLPLLKRAWQELNHAVRALPGFDMVDFGQACCAFHRQNVL